MCNFEITISKGNLLNKIEEYKVLTKSEVQKTVASGDDGVEETLLPIPNRKGKLYSVNGTAWGTVWESRTLPGKVSSLRLDTFFIFRNILDRVKACYAFTGQFSVNLLKRKKLSRRKHVMLLLDNLVEIYQIVKI